MALFDMGEMGRVVDQWERAIWEDLYHGETSLDKKLLLLVQD